MKGLRILFVPTSVIMHDYRLKVMPEKLYYLEKGRYLILRKYLSGYDFIFLSPSLITAEILTFGYSTRLGYKGVKNKLKALRDGFTLKIEKELGDKPNLYGSLCDSIPICQLTFNSVEKTIKLIANKIFYLNTKVFR